LQTAESEARAFARGEGKIWFEFLVKVFVCGSSSSLSFVRLFVDVQLVSLRLTMLVPGRLGRRRKLIGCVQLGGGGAGSRVESVGQAAAVHCHWAEMLASPHRHVACWHRLTASSQSAGGRAERTDPAGRR